MHFGEAPLSKGKRCPTQKEQRSLKGTLRPHALTLPPTVSFSYYLFDLRHLENPKIPFIMRWTTVFTVLALNNVLQVE